MFIIGGGGWIESRGGEWRRGCMYRLGIMRVRLRGELAAFHNFLDLSGHDVSAAQWYGDVMAVLLLLLHDGKSETRLKFQHLSSS